MAFLKPKTSWKTSHFLLNDAMFQRCFEKNIDLDVFDDVWKNPKHRINDASNDVNRPPLLEARLHWHWSLLDQDPAVFVWRLFWSCGQFDDFIYSRLSHFMTQASAWLSHFLLSQRIFWGKPNSQSDTNHIHHRSVQSVYSGPIRLNQIVHQALI